jgi:Dolichyl-phosphate-mannose-protein mannosyltransferase
MRCTGRTSIWLPWAVVLFAVALGLGLRLWFLWHFPQVNGDGLVYGDIAKNWLHGTYGLTEFGPGGPSVRPTLIRLPGYPMFLAACFAMFGIDHYGGVLYLQVALDLFSALLVAWTTTRIAGAKAGVVSLFLAALCPFTANYVAAPLTETLSVLCVALGCAALVWLQWRPGWGSVLVLAGSWSYATLLRPDGALLAIACFVSIVMFARCRSRQRAWRSALAAGLLSILPFLVWTARNLHTFHVFQPIAPRYAADPGEFTAPGFQHWMKTWAVDFTSTAEIYWNVETAPLDIHLLPQRAFDSPAQLRQTAALLKNYNEDTSLSPALDARFQALAEAREHAHPLRTYVWLPLLRVLDMWLRPRTEMLNIELRWWQYRRHNAETLFAAGYAALNLGYLVLAGWGAWKLRRAQPVLVGTVLLYCILRSLLLADIEAPEARYTVEAFPMLCIMAGAAFGGRESSADMVSRATS